ncbi:Uncharacterised protein [Legionella busanensis]|uniref:Uncharacterized protein n=1 Tax=Legionella busanensis TaxID=190655 RepID=A0A378JTS8_9GAMM|nr:hypothetical protein [Legionella busanensis]STX51592.1 Uncharacterised protein [Legionella busanensis]
MITLSFSQAILLLINCYKNELTAEKLKKLYLKGITSNEDLQYVINLFKRNQFDEKYQISTNARVINEDPIRRYFETHLAFETLLIVLDQIDWEDLSTYYEALYRLLPTIEQAKFKDYLNKTTSDHEDYLVEEYIDTLFKLKSNTSYNDFSEIQKNKLSLIFKCAWLSSFIVKLPNIPLKNVYQVGFFAEQQRGRQIKLLKASAETHGPQFKISCYSNNFGLMKNYMPIPKSDVIFTESGFSFIKSVDRVNFNLAAAWPKEHFSTLVHPFSCSISGTMLSQLRCMKKLEKTALLPFNNLEKFTSFLKCFTSSLLFSNGGHSYNEFLAVLKIPKVVSAFKFIDHFEEIDAINLMFKGNELQFNRALDKTITYTKVILAKQEVHDSLLASEIR